MSEIDGMVKAYLRAGGDHGALQNDDVAHLVIERDQVVGSNLVDGLAVEVEDRRAGSVRLKMVVERGVRIAKPVHLCFGVLPEEGRQHIDLRVTVEERAGVEITAHCVFPNAVDVVHSMEAAIEIHRGGEYHYRESHFHGESGGVEVRARSRIHLDEDSRLGTLFALQEGRAGSIDIDYETEVLARASLEMIAKVNGMEDDRIKIREAAELAGGDARALLETKVALRGRAEAEILNELVASADGAQGHVDCTEVIKDDAVARAVPVVDVRHPGAKVTHEAAIGSVDSKQLQTLMARGLDEEEATEEIIQGLLA